MTESTQLTLKDAQDALQEAMTTIAATKDDEGAVGVIADSVGMSVSDLGKLLYAMTLAGQMTGGSSSTAGAFLTGALLAHKTHDD